MKVKHKLTGNQFKRQLSQEIKKFLNHYSHDKYKITTSRHNKKEKILMLALNLNDITDEYGKIVQNIKATPKSQRYNKSFTRKTLNDIFMMIYNLSPVNKKEFIYLLVPNVDEVKFKDIYHDKYVAEELPLLKKLFEIFGISLTTSDILTQIWLQDSFDKIIISPSLTFKNILNQLD